MTTIDPPQDGTETPAVRRIFARWGLTEEQQRTLLDLTDEQSLDDWTCEPQTTFLSAEQLERASCILGIYSALETCQHQC